MNPRHVLALLPPPPPKWHTAGRLTFELNLTYRNREDPSPTHLPCRACHEKQNQFQRGRLSCCSIWLSLLWLLSDDLQVCQSRRHRQRPRNLPRGGSNHARPCVKRVEHGETSAGRGVSLVAAPQARRTNPRRPQDRIKTPWLFETSLMENTDNDR
jgi:hypothetical protein